MFPLEVFGILSSGCLFAKLVEIMSTMALNKVESIARGVHGLWYNSGIALASMLPWQFQQVFLSCQVQSSLRINVGGSFSLPHFSRSSREDSGCLGFCCCS
jgi:hypothetical protein